METERSASKIGERPMTRWRREQNDTPNPMHRPATAANRPHSKIERPISRRGIKNDSAEYSPSESFRAATPAQTALARPPTASVFSNRVPTATARLSTMSSASALGRLNTGLPIRNQTNLNAIDRPMTQYGVGGIRPGSTRGLARQVQDKRYYEGLLQLKIRELGQEIAVIMHEIDIQNKERATFLHYDKKAKDLATELTDLQGQLAEFNIVVDKMTSDTDKEAVEQDVKELVKANEDTLTQIEGMFEQRQRLEQKLKQMEKEIESERKSTEKLIGNMDAVTKKKFNALMEEKETLQNSVDRIQQDLDESSKEQLRLEEQIALSQLKQESVKLHIKIMEAEERRDKLKAEGESKLSPEAERENLLQKVKQDNMDIAAAEAQIAEKKKRITEIEQELEQLETDMEEDQTENKYKELRRREDIIEQFMSTFEENKKEELEKLEKLEQDIIEHLIDISNEIDTNVNSVNEEITIFGNQSLYENYEKMDHNQNLQDLSREYIKLSTAFKKMELLEQRLNSEFSELTEKIDKKQNELITLEDLDGLKEKSEIELERVTVENAELKTVYPTCEEELQTVLKEYNEIKGRLDGNDTFAQINALEKKLEKLQQETKQIQDFIAQQKGRGNYLPLKEHALHLIEDYNTVLKEGLKFVY